MGDREDYALELAPRSRHVVSTALASDTLMMLITILVTVVSTLNVMTKCKGKDTISWNTVSVHIYMVTWSLRTQKQRNYVPLKPGVLEKNGDMFKKFSSNVKLVTVWKSMKDSFQPCGLALVALKQIQTNADKQVVLS